MRLHSLDKRYALDRQAYQTFLSEQGFSDSAIRALNISIRASGPRENPTLLGQFRPPCSIFLYTHGDRLSEINDTLLHETRHYWQELEQEQKRHTAYARLPPRAYQKFLQEWFAQQYQEQTCDYWERPREQDARAWAARHASRPLFFSWQQIYSTQIPSGWLPSPEQRKRFERQVHHLGGLMKEEDGHYVVTRLARADVEKLFAFLQQATGKALVLAL
ncbi:MAG TPA: hypothetical protein VFA10_30265 [Ktedonobacteraceae bacterium]|nr:hypothetical protein [Ktedonobacteraceae bacterium]